MDNATSNSNRVGLRDSSGPHSRRGSWSSFGQINAGEFPCGSFDSKLTVFWEAGKRVYTLTRVFSEQNLGVDADHNSLCDIGSQSVTY